MPKTNLKNFDYARVAKYDANMWRAYYNHQFIKLFLQLLLLIKYQLGLGWLLTARVAYYAGWAAADYRIHRGNVNKKRVSGNLVKFYKIVSEHAAEPFNYQLAGELELKWWDIHRASYENNPELEASLANAAAAMFNIHPGKLREYAHYRAAAMILPRHQGDSKNNPTDWDEVAELVNKSWRALHAAVNGNK